MQLKSASQQIGTIDQIMTENVQTLAYDKSGKLSTKDQTLTLIPYFAWAHSRRNLRSSTLNVRSASLNGGS